MRTGYVPYMTIGEDLEVVHTCSENIEDVIVYFEQPGDDGFKSLKVSLHNFKIQEVKGFNDYEKKDLIRFCLNNYDLIAEYAKVGGVAYA